MTIIKAALTGLTPTGTASAGIFKGNPPTGTNLLDRDEAFGTEWSKDLAPGTYTFEVLVQDIVGTALTLTVTVGNLPPVTETFKLAGDSGTQVGLAKQVPFTIPANGGQS